MPILEKACTQYGKDRYVETKEGKKLQQNEEIMMKRTKKVSNWFIDSNGAKFSTFVSKKVVN
jgi:hypothetical protein